MAKKSVVSDTIIIPICRRIPLFAKIATYVSRHLGGDSYESQKVRFIGNGRKSIWDESVRRSIVERFEKIDKQGRITTTPSDGLILAEALLSMEAEGTIVECGCYTGGSTAKLSIVAQILGRKLFAFDSFEGLPEVDEDKKHDFHMRRDWGLEWDAGRYAGRLEAVTARVEKYGEISVCTFTKGWFCDTLKEGNLPDRICCAFVDVDMPLSARECLVALWPRLSDGGVYFTHDAAFIRVLQALLAEDLWREEFGEFPPILFGAGYGMGDTSPHLGFMVKGKAMTAEYINGLAIEK